jgi:hypothetical protein
LSVDSSTGEVRVNTVLDREVMDRAVLVIFVQDLNAAAAPNTTQSATGRSQ